LVPRNLWVHALSAIPENDLKTAADQLKVGYDIRHRVLPEEGLGLLKMKDGAFGDHYYIGEFPVASAHVELHDQKGRVFEGGTHVMHDSAAYAADLAVCDAVLANRLPGWETIAELVEAGMQRRGEEHLKRKTMLARTKVNFDLLSTVREEGNED